ncbi:hypothetical protein NQ314_019014 [Rhamnusium bicolor]|uniref:Peptidase S1 domain-containing protein n=1 Tax=Rhamnusium bicolor TaxID=1586634 RepID=A0AAV8WQ60_9CUCU|nr:hypothetical protein NQ314_019014 [Rhamnusium bicolor]
MFGGRDTCTGDSGGPLTKSMRVNNVRRAYVIGIVSYGLRECGTAPAVYVNVTHYVDWILENIKQS